MTQDLIQEALDARADEHELAFLSNTDSPDVGTTVLTLQQRRPMGGRRSRSWIAAAAVVVVALGIAAGLSVRDESEDLPVAGTGEPDAADRAPSMGADSFSDAAARTHLQSFVAALDRQDFEAAAEMLGGEDMAPSVATALNRTPDDDLGDALARYCDQDLVFCSGLEVGDVAPADETVRAFLVVTSIPPGALGGGEPPAPGVEHSSPFQVEWEDGSMRILDLPPKFDEVWDE